MTERAEKESCRFCAIVLGEQPAQVVFEDCWSLAFLDRRPLFAGHTLLVPRDHHATLSDLPAKVVGPLFANAKLLARGIEAAMGAEGSFVAINNRVSQSVPHLHIHIVPRRKGDGLKGFFWPRQAYRDEAAMAEIRAAIDAAVARLQEIGEQ